MAFIEMDFATGGGGGNPNIYSEDLGDLASGNHIVKCGFKPKRIYMSCNTGGGVYGLGYMYDEEVSTTEEIRYTSSGNRALVFTFAQTSNYNGIIPNGDDSFTIVASGTLENVRVIARAD